MHHADSQLDGCIGILDNRFLTVDPDLALIRLIQSVQDIHQCGFTGAALSDDPKDISLVDINGNILQHLKATKLFAYVFNIDHKFLLLNRY